MIIGMYWDGGVYLSRPGVPQLYKFYRAEELCSEGVGK